MNSCVTMSRTHRMSRRTVRPNSSNEARPNGSYASEARAWTFANAVIRYLVV